MSARPGLHIVAMEVPQPTAFFALPGLLRSDPDFLAAYVANTILGGAGIFFAADAGGARKARPHLRRLDRSRSLSQGGLLLGEVAAQTDDMRHALAAVRDTMRKFAADGPTTQELDDAKAYLNGSFPLTFASDTGLAAQLNAIQQMGLGLDYLDKRADHDRRDHHRRCAPRRPPPLRSREDDRRRRRLASRSAPCRRARHACPMQRVARDRMT